jgi:hypothetical protein
VAEIAAGPAKSKVIEIWFQDEARIGQKNKIADSDVKPASIPINIRPPFRFEAGHDSNQLPAGFRP